MSRQHGDHRNHEFEQHNTYIIHCFRCFIIYHDICNKIYYTTYEILSEKCKKSSLEFTSAVWMHRKFFIFV